MRRFVIGLSALSVSMLALAGGALAGSPLKGIDVKLGKNPGGGVSSRETDADGNFSFGVLPRGNYTIGFVFPKTQVGAATVVVSGGTGGSVTRAVKPSGTAMMSGTMMAGAKKADSMKADSTKADAMKPKAAEHPVGEIAVASDGIKAIAGNVSAGE